MNAGDLKKWGKGTDPTPSPLVCEARETKI